MFKFLFRRKADAIEASTETQRETILRALGEVNEIVAQLDDKPAVTFDPSTGAISFALPEQMPDEALALPAPEVAEEPQTAPEQDDAASDDAQDAEKPKASA